MAEEEKSVPAVLAELKDLTITYAKQETVEPIKGLGRYIGFGVGGSIVMGIGACLLGLGLLRALQTETGQAFAGDWSFAPYLFTVTFLGAIAAWAALQIKRDNAKESGS